MFYFISLSSLFSTIFVLFQYWTWAKFVFCWYSWLHFPPSQIDCQSNLPMPEHGIVEIPCVSMKNNMLLDSTFFFLLYLLALDQLLQAAQTKQVKTERLLILTVINASPTLDAPCNAKCACTTLLSSILFPLAALHWTIIDKPQFLTSWAHLNINWPLIIAGGQWVANVKELRLAIIRQLAFVCIQQEPQLFKVLLCYTIKPTNS